VTAVEPARPGSLQVWWLAARPKTLPVAVAPVLVGTALAAADGRAAWGPALAAGAGALLLQIGANLANDVFDFEKGADTEERLGPPRAAARGWLSPRALRRGTAAVFALAALLGCYLTAVGGWPILVVGVLSILAGLAYTGGPWPLGYHGLGELAVFVFFGCVAVCGSYWVQAHALPLPVLLASAAPGALAAAILVVNNLRDVDTDARAGKRTLAVRFGRSAARAQYGTLLALAYATGPLLWLAGAAPAGVWLSWLSLPLAARLAARVLRQEGPALNEVLAGTAKLELLFCALFAAGWLL
jgi:1,4-dihydroxy-2-naphthoate octaprenyltransferase